MKLHGIVKTTVKKCVAVTLVIGALLGPAAAYAAEEPEYARITADGVNMRADADTDSDSLYELALGTEVELLANEGSWYRVLYNGDVGYVKSNYVLSSSASSRAAYALDDQAVLRGGPSEDSYVISDLYAGQGVRIKSIIGEWYYVVANEQAGYVYRTNLEMSNSTTAVASMLKSGMEGEEVRRLQKELYDRGYILKADITGTFDTATRKAVLEYQQSANLSSADGIAGAETLASIYDSTNKLKKGNATFMKLKGTVVLLDWFEGGSDWLNKGARFTVTDVRTEKSFRARRFGGWYHADSEPITSSDTAVMKSLEGFSWNRRPIWVTYNGKTVAASMHTMPHMVNPTKSNNFDGHFCIHLLGSKVHETSAECPRHQSCVRSAYRAGKG